MNPVASFFQKYSAVPANEKCICWTEAREDTLLDWFNYLAPIVRCGWDARQNREATADQRRGLAPQYEKIVQEVRRRAALPNPSPEIVGAMVRANLPTKNYWKESEAGSDVDANRCIHGVPANLFCGRCES